jgi:hypothetical protein
LKICILQSNYIPWVGYFSLISRSDLCVFYDDVQYTKQDWRNRNLIKTPRGPKWLTVPVGSNISRHVNEVQLPNSNWMLEHERQIRLNYDSAEYFAEGDGVLQEIYGQNLSRTLSENNQRIIKFISDDVLKLSVKFASSTEFSLKGSGSARVLDLALQLGAETYLTGPRGSNYLNETEFNTAGIKLEYFEYAKIPEYPQPWPPFSEKVSIIDPILCLGQKVQNLV